MRIDHNNGAHFRLAMLTVLAMPIIETVVLIATLWPLGVV